jgi:hydrogenase maturation protease
MYLFNIINIIKKVEMYRQGIICIGNNILGDDGVSFPVGKKLSKKLNIKVYETNTFGFNIIDIFSNLDEVVIIDAVVIEGMDPGEVIRFNLKYFDKFMHLTSPHTFNLPTALKYLELYNQKPEKIFLYGITIKNEFCFSEKLSDKINKKIDKIVNDIYIDYNSI